MKELFVQLGKGIRSGVNKYAECRAGLLNLYEGYTVKQVNIVFDFIGSYNKNLFNLFKNLSEAIPKDTMKIKKLIDNMQRAVLFGNYNIVRRFKAFQWTFYLFLNIDFHISKKCIVSQSDL